MYNTDMPTRADLPSTGQLVRSTLIALAAATALLVTVILPSEYAVDPTGVGRMLGLTEMGEIKQQLAEEAAEDAAATQAAIAASSMLPRPEPAIPQPVAPQPAPDLSVPGSTEPVNPVASPDGWTDEVSLVLAPGEGAEIKLVMAAGAVATFEWVAEPGHLNSALHGDGTAGEAIAYRNGRAEAGHADELTAAFDGTHGWFWRNRSDETVTMTLRVRGQYSEVKRVI